MCYAFRDLGIQYMNGGDYSDIFYDNYIEVNNKTNVDKQIEKEQNELRQLIKQYKLIIETYPIVDLTVPYKISFSLNSVSDIQTWSKIPDILVQIQKTYSKIRRLKKSKLLCDFKTTVGKSYTGGNYKDKYLKYKMKYIKLKKILNI